MSLDQFTFERRGSTWSCSYTETGTWPFVLTARKIYHGTQRELATLELVRQHDVRKPILVLTARIDMLVASQTRGFAKEVAARLKSSMDADPETPVLVMVDAMREHLMRTDSTIDIVEATGIVLPDDPTPRYTLWPIVPESRPGMLVGPSGMGKSTAAQALGLTVVTGIPILPGTQARHQGPVFYIGQEENAEQWGARLEMICKGHNIPKPKQYYYLKLKGGSLIDSAEVLAEMVAKRSAVLVIIDSAQATWGAGEDQVREYASHWYNAVESLECPTLVIEHPNLADTRKNGNVMGFAAGSSVKRDRVGHAWNMKSISLPMRDGEPARYHVTLTDVKRNYVAKQADINYETQIHGYSWLRFVEAGALSPEVVLDRPGKVDSLLVSYMSRDPEGNAVGWTIKELAEALKYADDKDVRLAVVNPEEQVRWRTTSRDPGIQYTFQKISGTGVKGNPTRYGMVERQTPVDPIQMTILPGEPEGLS